MKCLTHEESKSWLAQLSISIDPNRNLVFPSEQSDQLMMTMPKSAPASNWFSAELCDWVVGTGDCMLWLSNWDTNPPYPSNFFEQIRKISGEVRHLIESPGHIFDPASEGERDILKGSMFLVMAFRWEGYVVSQDYNQFVYLGDQCVVCSSSNPEKMKQIPSILTTFGLRAIENIREAWSERG